MVKSKIMATEAYQKNKPLFNALLFGLFYFLLTWLTDFSEGMKILYIMLMIILPGITFPLSTSYYHLPTTKHKELKQVVHFVLSAATYHGSVWIFSGGHTIALSTVVAGFVGAALYLLFTKWVLSKRISYLIILLAAIASGLAFLPIELLHSRSPFLLGLAIFLWTMVNGLVLNRDYTTSTANTTREANFG
jgi:hypothetical protein